MAWVSAAMAAAEWCRSLTVVGDQMGGLSMYLAVVGVFALLPLALAALFTLAMLVAVLAVDDDLLLLLLLLDVSMRRLVLFSCLLLASTGLLLLLILVLLLLVPHWPAFEVSISANALNWA